MCNGIERGYALISIAMKKILLFFAFLMFVCAGYAQNYQEVVYLKNGSVIRGTVIEQAPGAYIKVQTSDGSVFAYNYSDVEKIVKDGTVAKSKSYNRSNSGLRLGYKGFVDFGYSVGVGDYGADRIEFSTTHGVQINKYIFAGAGVGVNYFYDSESVGIPIYAAARYTVLDKRITPFVEAKVGYAVGDVDGVYASPSIGCRFRMGNKSAFNVSVGYTLMSTEVTTVYKSGRHYNYEENTEIASALTFLVGFEF
jgi:hypothetical protein